MQREREIGSERKGNRDRWHLFDIKFTVIVKNLWQCFDVFYQDFKKYSPFFRFIFIKWLCELAALLIWATCLNYLFLNRRYYSLGEPVVYLSWIVFLSEITLVIDLLKFFISALWWLAWFSAVQSVKSILYLTWRTGTINHLAFGNWIALRIGCITHLVNWQIHLAFRCFTKWIGKAALFNWRLGCINHLPAWLQYISGKLVAMLNW